MARGRRTPPSHDRSSGEETVRAKLVPVPTEVRARIRRADQLWIVDRDRPRLVLGRAPGCDLRVDDERISRDHAAIELREGALRLRDDSTNGTYVVRHSGRMSWLHRGLLLLEGAGTLHLGRPESEAIEFSVEERRGGEREWQPTVDGAAGQTDASEFRRQGEFWTIAHAGCVLRLKDTKGLRYIAHLLEQPGREVLAVELAQLVSVGSASPGTVPSGDGLTPLDRRARTEYRRRLAELESDLEEAEEAADLGRAARARAELDAIATQLAAAIGLGGRDRPTASNTERARVTVTLRLRESLKKIRDQHPTLGAHLDASLRTGRTCSYRPPPGQEIAWRL